jgi:hypothetical protein
MNHKSYTVISLLYWIVLGITICCMLAVPHS